MVRPLRLSFENAFYSIASRGNQREKIFYSNRDKEVFLKRLKEMLIKYAMVCQAYCLMDNSAVSQAAKKFEQKSEINHKIRGAMQKVITALKEV